MSMDDNAMMAEVMRQSFEENPILWKRIRNLEKERDDLQRKLDELEIMYRVTMDNAVEANRKLDVAVEALLWYVEEYDDWIADAPINSEFAVEALKKIKGEV